MNLFSQLTLRNKIFILPIISIIGFLIYLLFNYYNSIQNEKYLEQINKQDYPILKIVNNDWVLLLSIEDTFIESITIDDDYLLYKAHNNYKKIKISLNSIIDIKPSLKSEILLIDDKLETYYHSAANIVKLILNDKVNVQYIQIKSIEKTKQLTDLKILLRKFKKNIELSLNYKTAQSTKNSYQTRITGIIIGSILILVLFTISIYITHIIIKPINKITSYADEITKGNWNLTLSNNNQDGKELNKLTNAFIKMQSKISDTIEDLIDSNNKAFKSAEAKSEFLSTISHELRTPMNGILGISELLKETNIDETQNKYINAVIDSSKKLLNIINDILDLSNLNNNSIALNKKPFDLEALVYEIHKSLSLTLDKNIKLIINYPISYPHNFIGDKKHIQQIIFNLLSNAIKFTKKGFVELNINCKNHDDNYFNIEFEVIDSGIGIKNEQQQNLFNAFSQIDSSITREQGGTGLGLAIAHKLVSLMGGELLVDSTFGKGSRFYFNIILSENIDANLIFNLSEEKKSLLLLNLNTSTSLYQVLKSFGLNITHLTETSQLIPQLIKSFNKNKIYSLIIIEHDYFNNENFQLARLIKKNTEFKKIPIIAFTSNNIDSKLFYDSNYTNHLFLPVSKKSIYITLQPYFENKSIRNNIKTLSNTSFSKNKLLLIDDNKSSIIIITQIISKFNVQYTIVKNNSEAIKICKTKLFDLILINYESPETNECKQIEKLIINNSNSKNIPIIAFNTGVVPEKKFIKLNLNIIKQDILNENDILKLFNEWLTPDKIKLEKKQVITSNTIKIDNNIIDINSFNKTKELLGDSFQILIDAFFDNIEDSLEKIHHWGKNDDVSELIRFHHNIKSTCSNLGALALSRIAAECEELIKNDNIDASLSKQNRLKMTFDKTTSEFANQGFKKT